MGYLGEIERRRQQEAQQELARKAGLERQQAREATDKNRRAEKVGKGFIKDSSTITSLLNQLYQFGYKGYFDKVSEMSGFYDSQIFYTEYPRQAFDSTDSKIPWSQLPEKGSELTKQQLHAQKNFQDAAYQFGWGELVSSDGIRGEAKNPSDVFFNDNPMTRQKSRLDEPREVGLGIRFESFEPTRLDRDWFALLRKKDHYYGKAAYVRIDAHYGATITGSSQIHVKLNDLRLFDKALHQAINNPAYVKRSILRTSGHIILPNENRP